jgi:hypothetical protein
MEHLFTGRGNGLGVMVFFGHVDADEHLDTAVIELHVSRPVR